MTLFIGFNIWLLIREKTIGHIFAVVITVCMPIIILVCSLWCTRITEKYRLDELEKELETNAENENEEKEIDAEREERLTYFRKQRKVSFVILAALLISAFTTAITFMFFAIKFMFQ